MSPNAEISQLCGDILSFCANLLDIKEHYTPSSNSISASVHLPCTLTGATAVFSKQTGLVVGLVAESGGIIAAVTAVGCSAVPSVLLVTKSFGLKTVCGVVSGYVMMSSGLLNSAPQRLV